MKKVILGFSLLGLISAANASDLETYMDAIKKPHKMFKRAVKKDATSEKALAEAKKFVEASKEFAKFKHKDDKFNKMNADFQKAVEAFEKVLKTKDADAIKKSFKDLNKNCKTCHEAYDV